MFYVLWYFDTLRLLSLHLFIYSTSSVLQPLGWGGYDTRFLELVRPRLAVLERRLRMGVAVAAAGVVGEASLGQPCWSKISMQPLLPFFLATIMGVWPWLSFAFTSIPYCGGRDGRQRMIVRLIYWFVFFFKTWTISSATQGSQKSQTLVCLTSILCIQ